MKELAITSATDNSVRQANDLLFASLFLGMDKVMETRHTLTTRPELSSEIEKVLGKMMADEMPRFKWSRNRDELKKAALNRITEWNESIGPLEVEQYAALSKYWDIPLCDTIKDKITPTMIYDLLDCFVIGQDDYKRQLAISFYLYLLKNDENSRLLDFPGCNLLVCGPSGSGKTFGIQTLARHFDIPLILVHCNTLVEEGIVGTRISDYFTSAFIDCKVEDDEEKLKMLSRAVVCFDEFDKLFESGYCSESVLNEILSCIDDNGEMRFRKGFYHSTDQVTVSTKNMMFVFTGVFQGLDKIRSGESMGFRNGTKAGRPMAKIGSDDLLKFGVKTEIVGRIHNCTTVEPLSVSDLFNVLNSSMDSPLNSFRNYFHVNDIEAVVSDEAKMLLAQMAHDKQLGVRGIKGLLTSILSEEMFRLDAAKELEINREYIEQHINY